MNYLDELLTLYPGRDWATQRYFLSHLSSLPAGLESDAILELLWGETASPHPELRHMARRQLGRILPGALRQAHGLEEAKIGIWTAWARDAQVVGGTSSEIALDVAALDRMQAAAWQRLAPLLSRTLELIGSGSHRVRLAASLVAGRIRTRSGLAALARGLKTDAKVSFWHAAAMADLAAPEAHDPLASVVRELGPRAPDLAMLLAAVAPAQALPALEAAERGASAFAATGVALALAGESAGAGRELLERLVRRNDPWVTAYALDAVAACPEPPDLAIARRVYERERRDFLRVLAVKVAGALPGAEPVDFLMHALRSGSPRVKAAALESLARKQVEPERVASEAAASLASPLLKLRVNAMLVLARRDPAAIVEPLERLTSADDAVERVEGAFVLGYLRASSAAQMLGDLAAGDPRLPVRLQAIKSLAKQDPAEAVPRLLAAARNPHQRTAALAARALAALPEPGLPQAAAALEEAARAAPSPAMKGVLLRAYGIASSRRAQGQAQVQAVPALLEAALSDRQERVVLGALEGLKGLGGPALAAVSRLARSPEARVRHRAAAAAFLTGDLTVVEPLDELLGAADESRVLSGLQALLEIGVLLPVALAAPPFGPLRSALGAIANETAVRTFAVAEEPAAARAPAAAPPQRAAAAAARFEPVAMPVPLRPAKSRSATGKRGLDAPLTRGAVEGTTYLADLPAASGWLATYRPLAAAAAVALLPLALMLSHRQVGEDPFAPLVPGALRIVELKGPVTRALTGKAPVPASLRGALAPGERLATGPAAQAMLSDGHGNVVSLGAASAVLLGVPPRAGPAYVLEEPEGDVLIDFKASKGVEVDLAADRITLDAATLRLTDLPGGHGVAMVAGAATLFRGGGAGQPLAPGQSVDLKPAP